jgi:hypothetical protein
MLKMLKRGMLIQGLVLASLILPAASAWACSNETARSQQGATNLPDCRAYELVSPLDTNGRLLEGIIGLGLFDLFPTELITASGNSALYMTYNGPLQVPGEPTGTFDMYQAVRYEEGWRTVRRVSPSGRQAVIPSPGGVSADHLYSFFHVPLLFGASGGSLAEEEDADYLGKPDGTFELTGVGSEGTEPLAQGRYISPDGGHIIFSTGSDLSQSEWCSAAGSRCKVNSLEPDAPPTGTGAVYDRKPGGPTRVVSLLPGNVPPLAGEEAFYKGSSKDGSSIAFEIGGVLYVRIDHGVVGQTLHVSDGAPVFAGLSDDGRFLFYVEGGESGVIHRFDTESKTDLLINPTAPGQVVNVSADGSHVYFISEDEYAGGGTVDSPNLYVWSPVSSEYVATVIPSDLEQTSGNHVGFPALTNWTDWVVTANHQGNETGKGPGGESSRTTPDGTVLVFESRAKLTPYENNGRTEIYRYDELVGKVICLSCNSGFAAGGDARLQNLDYVWPPIAINNLTSDGHRVFFETADGLVSRDKNNINDIYEWRDDVEGGSVHLISSVDSVAYPSLVKEQGEQGILPKPNSLLGVSETGADVLFVSLQPLTRDAGRGGVPAIYDARVEGGFPDPEVHPPCSEGGCRGASRPTLHSVANLLSEAIAGSGNVKRMKGRCHGKRRQKHKHRRRCSNTRNGSNRRPAAKASADQGEFLAGEGTDIEGQMGQRSPSATLESGKAASSAALAADGAFGGFGIESTGADLSSATAAGHPDFRTTFELNHYVVGGEPRSDARVENISVRLPPGLVGNAQAVPRCQTGEFLAVGNCPLSSQVGVGRVLLSSLGVLTEPIYNLAPPHPATEIVRLGMFAASYPVLIDIRVRTSSDYGVVASVHGAPGQAGLLAATTTIWGNPSDAVHDEQRLTAPEAIACRDTGTACEYEKTHGGKAPEVPRTNLAFMTNPSACQEGKVDFGVTSYQLPGQLFTATAPLPPITDCTGLPFTPTFSAEPTSHVAGAPTGLKTKLVLPQHLLADERATATMREARVTLPEGMQVAAGAANWIGTCSDAQVGYRQEVDTDCPDSSKLGTATIKSPALSVPIEGTIYQRAPSPGHQLGLWLTSDALGMHIKLPGELEPDKTTGRLTAVFRDLPQVPVEEIELNVWGGDRAPLQNPDHCGTFTTDFSFSPHSNDPAATGQSQMQITEGCDQGFNPSLKAGVTNPLAGKYSPFVFDLTRPDGDQALRGFDLKLPDGELAKIKGVPLCGDADATAGTCPAGSRIGSLSATTGPGPEPFTLPEPGKPQPQIYLAGPYKGAPFSIVSEVPAQAGPFDLGTLAVRNGLEVEPETGRAVVKADPLPQFFEGVGIAYRHLHAVVDRPEFNLNPTDCREMAVTSDVTSTRGTVAHPSARFQVDGCKALKFKPKLSLKLKGGTKRADYPALTAVLKARKGDANIAFASVALPHSEFLAQEHIGTICTRKQFVADKCPKGSVYGKAKAFTPLLDKPLSGPVYLRSSDHPLPDLVAKLGGQLEIHLVGRIDSKNGGIRTTFESVPDAPVTKFVLRMRGGKKGLLTNSTDICRGSHRATGQMKAQNGRAVSLRPELVSSGCGKKKLGKHKKHH